MKIAVLSDIHSNIEALKACVDYIENNHFDSIIFLGDYITDYPTARETMDFIYKIKEKYSCFFIKGNREDYMIDYFNGLKNWTKCSKNGALLYNALQLNNHDIAFFQEMPIYQVIEFDGCSPFMIMHGSYERNNHLIRLNWNETANNELNRIMEECPYDLMIGGHSHVQIAYHYHHKKFLNPGPVGVQSDKTKTTKMMSLEYINNEWKETFIALDYDIDKMAELTALEDYLSYSSWWGIALHRSLYTGEDAAYYLVVEATKIADEENTSITEAHFDKVAKQLKLDDYKKKLKKL